MLYVRSSAFRLILLFVLLAAAELFMFYLAVEKCMAADMPGLEYMFEKSRISWVMAFVFVLMSIQLSIIGCEYGSKQGYTLRRLRVSEGAVFAWQAAFNALMYFVLWAVQLALVLLMASYATEKMGSSANNQTLFLAFYRNDFLHSLLPLDRKQ